MSKSPIRLERFSDLNFQPRFEYGHMAEVANICSSEDGTVQGSGFVRFKNAYIPWTIRYDEVVTVIEGEMTIKTADESYRLKPLDSIWLPDGTELIYEAKQALVSYAIYPNRW